MGTFNRSNRLLGLSAAMLAAAAVQPAAAQGQPAVSNSGTGSAVVIPYYTVNDDWRTLVNLTNTTDNSLVVKVRLHEARNSRDILDFNVGLSPNDQWTAFITDSGNGLPRLQSTDRSCTSPLQVRQPGGVVASELAYSGGFRDHEGTDGDTTRASEGYIVITVMGESPGNGDAPGENGNPTDRGDTAWNAEHVNGEPRNCNRFNQDFTATTGPWGGGPADPIPGVDGSGNPLARDTSAGLTGFGYGPIVSAAPLKVNASLIKESEGIGAGVESLHISGFGVGQNLVTAQQFPWFLEPTLASGTGLWTTGSLAGINAGIAAVAVGNEWTSNPTTGASADWTLSFPTKRFQADEDAPNIQAACNIWRNDTSAGGAPNGGVGAIFPGWAAGATPNLLAGAGDCPALGFPTVFQDGNNGRADIAFGIDVFDREEGVARIDGPVVSPAPPPDRSALPWETNVLRIGVDANNIDSALDSAISIPVDTAGLVSGATAGWLAIGFGTVGAPAPFPVTGFIFKKRDFGDPSLNFGQATEHAYDRFN